MPGRADQRRGSLASLSVPSEGPPGQCHSHPLAGLIAGPRHRNVGSATQRSGTTAQPAGPAELSYELPRMGSRFRRFPYMLRAP